MIRPATGADFPRLQVVERNAGESFRALGVALVADDEPFSDEELQAYVDAGRAWVATDPAAGEPDRPVAYVLVDLVDGSAHVAQVSVDPPYSGRGIGRALLERVADWARRKGMPALTLTAYTEVPWNGPYYERLGFRRLATDEETPGLRTVRTHERAHGLDAWPRTCMRREL